MTTRSNHPAGNTPASGYQRRRLETRAQLLDAARGLFIERGVEQVSIDAITSTAGVAKGSFYNHFESRQALFDEILEATLQDVFQRAFTRLPVTGDPLEDGLARTWYIHYTLLSDPRACTLLLQSGGSATAGGAIDRVLREGAGDRLSGGASFGSLSHIDRDLLYAAYFGAVTQAMGYLLEQGESLDVASAADQLTEICFAMLGLPHHRPAHLVPGGQGDAGVDPGVDSGVDAGKES